MTVREPLIGEIAIFRQVTTGESRGIISFHDKRARVMGSDRDRRRSLFDYLGRASLPFRSECTLRRMALIPNFGGSASTSHLSGLQAIFAWSECKS
jgi:hypothetical protein